MQGTRTPGKMFAVRQALAGLAWQVHEVDEAQGEQMLDRKEPYVYKTSTQAYAVRDNLNLQRLERKLQLEIHDEEVYDG